MKYSDELRKELHDLAGQGYNTTTIGKMYGISDSTVSIVLSEHWEREKRLANKRLMGELHGKQEKKQTLDAKDYDARQLKIWIHKFKQKLNETKLYNNLPVEFVGDRWFTYKTAGGYNKTSHYADIYAGIKRGL
ncbi:MAG: hypothetical protein ACRCX8_01290 [Sarcina sp.]